MHSIRFSRFTFSLASHFLGLGALTLIGCAQPDASTDGTAETDSASSETSSAVQTSNGPTGGLTEAAALARLQGPFTGEWTIFGVDDNGAPRVVMHWTDEVTTSAPTRSRDRVTVDAHDTITLDGSSQPCPATGPETALCKYKTWKEGYFRSADGSIGDRFIDMGGQITISREIAPNTFTMVEPATAGELQYFLGFKNAVSGTHVTVKVVTTDGSIDTERISRVTTVQWKDDAGTDRFTQMVTMTGEHRHAASR